MASSSQPAADTVAPRIASPPRPNNFHLIRLLAAGQVVILHTLGHLNIPSQGWLWDYALEVIRMFPGVPVFFTISGFLITWSYLRNRGDWQQYLRNRALRIFPALWVCLALTVGSLVVYGYGDEIFGSAAGWAWLAGQLSFAQFYTPEFFADWGVGNPNGALWTITVELQFYLLLPLLLLSGSRRWQTVLVLAGVVLSVGFYVAVDWLWTPSLLSKLSKVTVVTYLYNFLFGVLAFLWWPRISGYLTGRLGMWLLIYFAYYLIFHQWLEWYDRSYTPMDLMGWTANLLLAIVTLSAAFSVRSVSDYLIGSNDISYGVYIYHIPIINVYHELGWTQQVQHLLTVIALTTLLSWLSWKWIERPALAHKKQ